MRTNPKPDLRKGLLAGAVGGLVACFAMSQFHLLFQKVESPSEVTSEDSTVKASSAVSQKIFHHQLTPDEKKIAGLAMHYGFGASIAAFYGAAVEVAPVLGRGGGTPFGASVWLGAHVITVPALGLSEPVSRSTPRQEAIEFGAHLIYGAVVESMRRLLRTQRSDLRRS